MLVGCLFCAHFVVIRSREPLLGLDSETLADAAEG
jgi:hypothetical protein